MPTGVTRDILPIIQTGETMVIELDYSEEKQHQTLVQTMYIDDEKHCILYVQTLRNLLRYLKGELFNV